MDEHQTYKKIKQEVVESTCESEPYVNKAALKVEVEIKEDPDSPIITNLYSNPDNVNENTKESVSVVSKKRNAQFKTKQKKNSRQKCVKVVESIDVKQETEEPSTTTQLKGVKTKLFKNKSDDNVENSVAESKVFQSTNNRRMANRKPQKRKRQNESNNTEDTNQDHQETNKNVQEPESKQKNPDEIMQGTDENAQNSSEFDSDESDGLQDFFETKKTKYKPRRKPQLTEEQKAERERKSIEKRTCVVCSMVFAFPGGLRNHMRSKHTFEKPYSCEFCDEKFAIQSSYSLHRRRHLGIKPHLCNLCGKTFLRKMDLHIHMRIHVPSEDKIRDVKCSYCPKVYTSKINLNKHVLTKHTDPSEWKHDCSICGKKLYSATALTHHIRQHNDDRRYKCVICGRGFFTKQNMNIHVRTHSADTPFNCEHCSSGYRSNEALQRHLLKVHGIGEEKPVSTPTHFCLICNESFRQRARLEQHVELHETGEEEYPFECEKCHRRYKARNYFTIHMLEKHGLTLDENYFKTFNFLRQRNYTGIENTAVNEHFSYNCSSEDLEYENSPDTSTNG